MTPVEISVVVPAYNERRRLVPTLEAIIRYLDARGTTFEVIVVDDGSTDGTADVARRALAALGPRGRVLENRTNLGKGASVRRGMRAARGPRVLFSDADLSVPMDELPRLEAALDDGAQVAIGSRALDRTRVEVPQSWTRDHIGRLFNVVVRSAVLPGVWDTQCGFKLFARAAVEPIFSRQRIDRFGFDVEVLAIARRLGYAVAEVPVRWRNVEHSRVTFVQGAAAFLDPLRVRLGLLLGRYDAADWAPDGVVSEELRAVEAK